MPWKAAARTSSADATSSKPGALARDVLVDTLTIVPGYRNPTFTASSNAGSTALLRSRRGRLDRVGHGVVLCPASGCPRVSDGGWRVREGTWRPRHWHRHSR